MGPGHAQVPEAEVRVLRGRDRLDPVPHGPASTGTTSTSGGLGQDFGGEAAERSVPRALARVLHLRPDVAEAPRGDRRSTSSPSRPTTRTPTRCGPTRPSSCSSSARGPGLSDDDIDKITWKNVARFCSYDPFAVIPKEQATVGALRALSPDVDTSVISRKEWRARYEADPAVRVRRSSDGAHRARAMDGSGAASGFIGLGDMGGAMVQRIIDAGFPTVLWARRPQSLSSSHRGHRRSRRQPRGPGSPGRSRRRVRVDRRRRPRGARRASRVCSRGCRTGHRDRRALDDPPRRRAASSPKRRRRAGCRSSTCR